VTEDITSQKTLLLIVHWQDAEPC